MIKSNTGPDGSIDVDAFQRAILQYRNTPDQHTKLSPAMIIFGRAIKDFIPVLPGKYRPHNTWREMLEDRETALRNRHMKDCERLTEHTKRLLPLVVGDCVRIQNQTGNHPKKWDKTGVVVEVKQFDQYVVRVDGSGRGTLRNRQFLRKYTPVLARPEPTMATRWTAPQPYIPPTPQSSPTTLPATTKGPLEGPPHKLVQDRSGLLGIVREMYGHVRDCSGLFGNVLTMIYISSVEKKQQKIASNV